MRAQSQLLVSALLQFRDTDVDLCHGVLGLQLVGLCLDHLYFVRRVGLPMLALYVGQARGHAFLWLVNLALLLQHRDLHDFVVRIHVVLVQRDELLALLSHLAPLVLGYVDDVSDES